MDRVLVTGGAGFIGSHLAQALIYEGYEVHILDNLSSGHSENIPPKAIFHKLDIRDRHKIDKIFEELRFTTIFHEAAQMSVIRSVADPANDALNNIVGTVNILDAGKKNGLKKIIFASSGGVVYGNPIHVPQDENHPLQPVSPYGISKATCEKYLHHFWEHHGISYIALRYSNVYGPRQSSKSGAGIIGIFMEKILAGEQPIINGHGTKTRDYIYVEDVVSANLLSLKHKGVGPFNIGTGIETDVTTIFNTIKQISGVNVLEIHGPDAPGEQNRSVLDISRAKERLHWSPAMNFDDGIRKTIEWYLSQPK